VSEKKEGENDYNTLIILSFSSVLPQRQRTLVIGCKESLTSSLGLKGFKSDPLWPLVARSGADWICIFLLMKAHKPQKGENIISSICPTMLQRIFDKTFEI
jgi:hypothetical protein